MYKKYTQEYANGEEGCLRMFIHCRREGLGEKFQYQVVTVLNLLSFERNFFRYIDKKHFDHKK